MSPLVALAYASWITAAAYAAPPLVAVCGLIGTAALDVATRRGPRPARSRQIEVEPGQRPDAAATDRVIEDLGAERLN